MTITTTRERLATRLQPRRRGSAIARITLDGRLACLGHDYGTDTLTRADLDALVELGTNPHCSVCGRRWAR